MRKKNGKGIIGHMSERGPEISSIERNFTIGKVEKKVEQKIQETTDMIVSSGLLKKDNFKTEEERSIIADSVVEFVSDGVYKNYGEIVDAKNNKNVDQTKVNQTFDVLKKSTSLAMNGDQELQTKLYMGRVSEVIPDRWKEEDDGIRENLDLASGVIEVTITDQDLQNKARKLDKISRRVDLKNDNEREFFAKKIEDTVIEVLDLEVSDDKENELVGFKSYLSNEAAILRGIYTANDGSKEEFLVKRSDSVDKSDVKAVLGDAVVEALNKNTEAVVGNTGATEKNTGAVLDLNKALEGYTTAIQTSTQMEILAKLKSSGLIDEGAQLSTEIMRNLEMEVDNPSLFEIKENDDEETKTDKLLRRQKAKQQAINMRLVAGIDLIKDSAVKGPKWPPKKEIPGNRETWEGDISELYDWLDSIEKGTRSIDDLSTNSTKFGYLYRAQNGDYDNFILGLEGEKGLKYNGKRMDKAELDIFKQEISMRLFLHSLNLAASKCSSIEDIMRVVSTMHEGDINGDLDKLLLSTFLNRDKKGTGLNKIPVDKAWDLRQKGYFEIEKLLEDINGSGEFKNYLAKITKENNPVLHKLYKDVMKDGGFLNQLTQTQKDIDIKANPRFFVKDYYDNWFKLEKSGTLKADIIKEYMLWKTMEEIKDGTLEDRRKKAEKAFDLAHKLSVATFMDSAANLAFAQDDYAEIINFKLLRYSDGPNGKTGRSPKNKPIGSPETIGHLNSLTCHWMYLLRDKEAPVTTTYSPLYTNDINLNQYKQTTAMSYHFFGVVGSQVEFVKQAFFEKFTSKDVLSPLFLNKVFAKINKTAYDMCRAKIAPLHFGGDTSFYDGLYDKSREAQTEAKVAEQMRAVWLLNTFRMASDFRNGWTTKDVDNFIKVLRRSDTILDENGKSTSFVSIDIIKKAIKLTNVRTRVAFHS